MQETKYDGKEVFTKSPTDKQIMKAVKNPKNKRVTFHNVGSYIKMTDGTIYEIQGNGSWIYLPRIKAKVQLK